MDPRRRFRFLKELSEGAFGKVYMAEMITGDNFRSIVAIKLLHGKWLGHQEIVQRSRDEARVLGLLHHRNIIRVEDLTAINGQCAVVMEFLDGVDVKTLINYCKENGDRIPFKVAFEVIAAVASALEAAYNSVPLQGGEPLHLIHRDIKPSNVMVTKAGDVKVLDFGTAQASFDEREAHTQALAFGSAAYMAPERLLGDPDAPSGDVFSLGITLYEMLAQETFGKVHIRPEKYEKELDRRIEAIDLSVLDAEREPQVRQVMRLLLAYERDDRPTAGQVVDLMEALADEVHDGSMRRFARSVVTPCRDCMEPRVNPDDPLTGSTLFEDRLSGARAFADLNQSGDDDGDEAAPDGDAPIPFQTPPELAGEDPPVELMDEDLALDAPQDAQSEVRRTMAPTDDAGLPPGVDPFVGMDSVVGAPSIDAIQAPARNLAVGAPAPDLPGVLPASPATEPPGVEAPTTGAPTTQAPAIDPSGTASPPESAEQTPDLTTGGQGPSLPHEPGVVSASQPKPPPVAHAAVPRNLTPAPDAPSKGGGKLVIALVALAVVGVIVVGGGFVAAKSFGLLGGDDGSVGSPSSPPAAAGTPGGTVRDGRGPDGAVPGGTIEIGAMDGTNGAISLVLNPPDSGQVSVSSGTGFRQSWDGTGRLTLIGLTPGIYKTKVSRSSGSTIRGTLDVRAGKTCSYVFSTTQDDAEWTADGCK
ncbi:MAG: protein kinase [Oligoflexia bacterium]|nr:protein kinase [Oligoflexia bacterium]